jgi:hypothetical protein
MRREARECRQEMCNKCGSFANLEQPANGCGRDKVRVRGDLLDESGCCQRDAINEGSGSKQGVQEEGIDRSPHNIHRFSNWAEENKLRCDPEDVQQYAYEELSKLGGRAFGHPCDD